MWQDCTYIETKQKWNEHLRLIAYEENVNLIGITESHLNENIQSAEVSMGGFQLYRADRVAGTKKGGVAIYIRYTINAYTIDIGPISTGTVECQMLYITMWNVVLVAVYRPECNPNDLYTTLGRASRAIEARGTPAPNILILGDFNFPNVDWLTTKLKGASKSLNAKSQARALLQFMESQCLAQLIIEPTRGRIFSISCSRIMKICCSG